MVRVLRLVFLVAAIAVTFLALTPAPIGQVIESGPVRHVLAFAVLPLLSRLAWPRVSPWVQFAGFGLFGAAIEIAQLLMHVGRKAEWDDWFADLAATALALLLAWAIQRVLAGRMQLEPR
jgi:glycopeptide antibiotics resistance protein